MKKIDVSKAIKSKSPKLYNLLPGFIISYLKSIVHENELNAFVEEYGDKKGNKFTKGALDTLGVKYTVEFKEPLNKNGRFILVCNHPLGGPDGIILIDYFSRYFSKVKFPVNDILLQVENMSDYFIPINKHGMQSRDGARLMEEALASNAQILMFPAGLVSRKKNSKIEDLEWQKHFISKAIKHKRDVVPVYISGKNSNFFYNLANIRSFLGIKMNLEMLYLSDELFKQRGKNFSIKVGKPIKYNIFDRSKTPFQWAQYVRKEVYNLE